MKRTSDQMTRRGIVTPLVALLLAFLIGMMAFSIDIGYAVYSRTELVNATDAAALAGVQQLYAPYRQWQAASTTQKTTIYNNAITNAKATATAVANSNTAGGSSVLLIATEVDVGYTDSTGKYYSGNLSKIPSTAFPNTVMVTARRDNTNLPNSNGELPLFFGPVLGTSSMPLTASPPRSPTRA